jgi:hypothetical protein
LRCTFSLVASYESASTVSCNRIHSMHFGCKCLYTPTEMCICCYIYK